MPEYTINTVEDAILSVITTNLTYLKQVLSYGGISRITTWYASSLETVLRHMPCVIVEYRRTKVEAFSFNSDVVTYEFAIIAVSRNLPTEEKGRKKTNNIYSMLEDIKDCVMDKYLGLDLVVPITLESEKPEYYFKIPEISTYEGIYSIAFVREGASCGS